MRIALLTDGLWPDVIGGMQKHSYYLARYLSLNHIKVDLYYCANDDQLIKHLFSPDELINIRLFKVDFPDLKFRFPGHYVWRSYIFSKKLYQVYIRQQPYDFTYAQGFTGWYFVKKGIRVGSNLHGLEMFQKTFGFKSNLVRLLLRIPAGTIISKSYISFSLGGRLTQILKSRHAINIRETPIGIGEDWLCENTIKNDAINFIFIGRYEKRKGLDLLFEVLEQVNAQSYLFHFIGINRPENMKRNESLIFHGEIKDAEKIKEILSACDVLVCPSIAEGMPTVILEAMSRGLAVIATDTGATALLVDRLNGLLIQPDNKEELLRGIKMFTLINRDELQVLKNYSFQKVSEKFIWPVSIKTTIQALKF